MHARMCTLYELPRYRASKNLARYQLQGPGPPQPARHPKKAKTPKKSSSNGVKAKQLTGLGMVFLEGGPWSVGWMDGWVPSQVHVAGAVGGEPWWMGK